MMFLTGFAKTAEKKKDHSTAKRVAAGALGVGAAVAGSVALHRHLKNKAARESGDRFLNLIARAGKRKKTLDAASKAHATSAGRSLKLKRSSKHNEARAYTLGHKLVDHTLKHPHPDVQAALKSAPEGKKRAVVQKWLYSKLKQNVPDWSKKK